MSDTDGFNPFDDADAAADTTATPVNHSPPSSHSPSSSTSEASPSTHKPSIFIDTKPTNGHRTEQHDKETLYDHLAHTDPAPSDDYDAAVPPHDLDGFSGGETDTVDEFVDTRYAAGSLVSTEPSLFLDFQLAAQPDSYTDVLTSLASLTTHLATLQSTYTAQHAATLAASHAEQHHHQQQQTAIRHDISTLHTQLTALHTARHAAQQRLHALTQSVAASASQHQAAAARLAELAAQHEQLAAKLHRRGHHLHRQQGSVPRPRLATLRPAGGGGGRGGLVVPLVAVVGVFGLLTVREVESVERTCRRWRWVVRRSAVWKLGMRRVAGNKRRKEREREETGEQVTRDEFDEWTERDDQHDTEHEHEHDVGGDESPHALDGHHHAPASPTNKRRDDAASVTLTPAAAAALNLPPVDSPVPDHLHYALTVDLTRDLYSINITSRRIHTLYQCAGCMDSLTPGQPPPQLPKTSSVVICCTLVPKAASVTELQFCEQMMGMQEQMAVAKQDVQRLTRQVKEDGEVKRRLQTELSEREAELRKVQAELDFSMQQQMSDEMTRQFLDDSVATTTEQLAEERAQTTSLRAMLRDAYVKREAEVGGMESEVGGMVAAVDGLKEEKAVLTREVKKLQVELDGVTSERERAKREYERLMALVEQLREL